MKLAKIRPQTYGVVLCFCLTFSANSVADKLQSLAPNDALISLQFVDIELVDLLQALAKLGNTNFLLSESIKGRISIDLNNTPWQTALHSILAS